MKKQKMKALIKDLGHENESLKFQLDKANVDNESLKKQTDNFEIENNRLSSKNTVLVQSIENLIKEAKNVLELNEKHHFEVKEEPKDWIPQVDDVCEVVGRTSNSNIISSPHNIMIGRKVRIFIVHENYSLVNVIGKHLDYWSVLNEDLKLISRPELPKPETRTPIV